ncbi:DUF1622 domain-containing protein [Crocosphaera sp. UHCC 0190]|uniref:DUF1622 domain-containing protein n=1 Tax=Crocosphaera sp. UHCC 0190 TaxID=3110246 RepID=UPI002B21A45E|nr:DUF1622 domain-containing protein [Crocosphaera sp. UHCC 0190]MEA5510113.1 DUF1622 domain-containing protein [Crocosphaera sp. UHCC 0190]
MRLLEHLAEILERWVGGFRLILEFVSVVCVICGFFGSFRALILGIRRQSFPFLEVRIRFGSWLALALEFQLGSDILSTTVAPSWETLGKLGAIAVIRTFLNYFLNQELEAEQSLRERRGN